GQVNEDVLELIHKSEAWLEREVKAAGYNGINDVFLGEYIDGQLRLTGYSK
ncbi:MAG: YetF domain-containing protein, partial [Lactobacillus helveticus]